MKTNWNRRDFLKTASAATLSALAAGYPRALLAADAEEKIKPTADTLIVLWLAGGMAHTETFDPKRHTPFERGMKPDTMFSTFPTIDTANGTPATLRRRRSPRPTWARSSRARWGR